MKKNTLKICLIFSVFISAKAVAQTPFNTIDSLDINQLNASALVHGNMWYNPATGSPAIEYPKGSGKHASYLASIWMSGKDNLGSLYVSAQTYSSSGIDYYPGPLDAAGNLDLATSTKWAKIWKVNATTINDFKTSFATGGVGAITAAKYNVIKEWPAKGNIYAKGNGGVGLSITTEMAPFVDVNSDSKYDWKDGDYPKIKGDQMLWWIFSDNGPAHTSSKGTPLKVEYQAMAYGYSRGSAVDRMIFYEFSMTNKSTERYNEFRFGLFSDADLGNASDDYIAFDSAHRMGIEYNAEIPDRPNGANSYGKNPPISGLSFIEMPGDVYPSGMQAAGTFNYYNNGPVGPLRDPKIAVEYNNYLHAKNADGINQPFGKYAFPITKGAIMCDSNYPTADRRYLITSGDYAFQPNTKTKIAMVFMVTDTNGNACPGVNFKAITDLADTAWKIYYNPLNPMTNNEILLAKKSLKVYPNPAQTNLYVSTGKNSIQSESLRVVDALGRTIALVIQRGAAGFEINIEPLAPGVYSVIYTNGIDVVGQTFVKE